MKANLTFPAGYLALCLACMAAPADAADPQPYTVTIAKTGDAELDGMLAEVSTLISLKDTAPVGPFALVARARTDSGRFLLALQSLGYYQGKVEVRIANHPLNDLGLYDIIEQAPASPALSVQVSAVLGKLFHVRELIIDGDAPTEAKQWLGLKKEAPARAADIQRAGGKLLSALQERGYALAKVEEPVAKLLPETDELDVTYRVHAGKPVTLGKISVQGLDKIQPIFIDHHVKIAAGQPFKLSSIEKNRQALQALGVFSSVRARLGEGLDAQKLDVQQHMPVTFVVGERLPHTIHLGAAYSTDLGGSFTNYWQHHNLLGYGEQLSLNAGVTQLGGNSTTDVGYNVAATFSKPDFLLTGQTMQLGLTGIRQYLLTYNEDAILGTIQLNRRLTPVWTGSFGLGPEQATITQEGKSQNYTLLTFPVSLKYNSSNSLLNPTKGSMATLSLTPVESLTENVLQHFVIMQVSASTYWDWLGKGRSVLALRGLLGDIEGAGRFALPPDKRFYAGGSNTVRGYRYQAIGPQFQDGNPQGGTAIATATVELRQRILEHYGFVTFADIGQVSPSTLLVSGDWRIGAGVGGRYYTDFGPLRLDVAFPVNPQSNSGSFEVYFGLGQAF